MRILITGGMGFIGSHLTARLLKEGHKVTVLDNFSTPAPGYKAPKGVKVLRMGVADCTGNELSPWRYHPQIDAIFHLASPVGPAGLSGETLLQITEATKGLLRLIGPNLFTKVIAFSTSEVYGGGSGLREDSPIFVKPPFTRRTQYQIGKLAMENILLNAHLVDCHIVRPCNIVGPRQRVSGGFVLPRFIEQYQKGEALTVFSPGTQTRCLTHVDDLMDFCMKLLHYKYKMKLRHYEYKGPSSQIWNVANPRNGTTILDLACRIAGPRRTKLIEPLWPDAPSRSLSIEKAQLFLGWKPKVSLPSIIRQARQNWGIKPQQKARKAK